MNLPLRFPRRVESTIIMLDFQVSQSDANSSIIPQASIYSHPSHFSIISNKCKFSRLVENFHWPVCPSVLLKYALPPFFSGRMYQLPHLSFAINGLVPPKAAATSSTKSASCCIECRRFVMDKLDRLRSPRSRLMLLPLSKDDCWDGKRIFDSDDMISRSFSPS